MKEKLKYSGKVLIEKEKDTTTRTAESIRRNPHARDNVNVPQGPRVGNDGSHDAKRGNFKTAKEERAPLADFITRGFEARGQDDKEHRNPGLESISADSKRKFKSSKTERSTK